MHLSRFFTLAELTRSDTAAREGIPNQPAEAQIGSLRTLCTTLLDPLREAVARPMRVSSGFRGPALNARIGGSATSQHSQGQAADVQVPGLDMLELFKTVIRLGLPFDQLIYEAQSATVKWVHLSHRASGNRGEIRVAQFNAAGRPTGYPLVSAEQALAMTERTTRSSRASLDPGYIERADEPEFEPAPELVKTPPVLASTRRRSGSPAAAKGAPAPVAVRKAPAKKVQAAKAATQKAPAKTGPAKTAPAKKTSAKKANAKSVPAHGSAAGPATARRATSAQSAADKAPAKKAPAKASAANGGPTKKAGAKKATAKAAPAKKTAARTTAKPTARSAPSATTGRAARVPARQRTSTR